MFKAFFMFNVFLYVFFFRAAAGVMRRRSLKAPAAFRDHFRCCKMVFFSGAFSGLFPLRAEKSTGGECMQGTERADIKPGMKVLVVQKQDQRSGALTEGVVQSLLTKSPHHPHGIKVRLESGVVGRVKEIIEE